MSSEGLAQQARKTTLPRVAGRPRHLLTPFEHYNRALLGDPEGFFEALLGVIIRNIERDRREFWLLRQVLEERRLRSAGGAPVGMEHDGDRLTRGFGRIKLTLVKRQFCCRCETCEEDQCQNARR